jgi:hypothetical protein
MHALQKWEQGSQILGLYARVCCIVWGHTMQHKGMESCVPILITLITYLFSCYSSLVLLAFVLACACVPPSLNPSVHVFVRIVGSSTYVILSFFEPLFVLRCCNKLRDRECH